MSVGKRTEDNGGRGGKKKSLQAVRAKMVELLVKNV